MAPYYFPQGALPNGYSPTGYPSPLPSSATNTRSPTTAPSSPASTSTLGLTSLSDHLMSAWKSARYADLLLEVTYASGDRQTLHLHAVVVSRAPALRNLLEQHNSPGAMGIRMPDPAVNHAAFSLVIASLYSPSVVRNLTLDNAFATLAAAVFLGLEDVAALAAELCDSSIRKLRKPGEMASWFGKLKDAGEAFGASGRGGEVYGAGWSRGGGGGTATVSGACREGTGAKVAPRFGYGALGARLWVSLLRRVLALPEEYGLVEGGEDLSQGHERMVLLLSALPFEVLKNTLESSRFDIPGGEMERFKLAKAAIAERKRRAGVELEETVVLASGGGDKDKLAITVLQRAPRRSALWKIGGP